MRCPYTDNPETRHVDLGFEVFLVLIPLDMMNIHQLNIEEVVIITSYLDWLLRLGRHQDLLSYMSLLLTH